MIGDLSDAETHVLGIGLHSVQCRLRNDHSCVTDADEKESLKQHPPCRLERLREVVPHSERANTATFLEVKLFP